ncbi:MAG: class II aldolase/adducin family protein [Rhodospirillaceae bacterium]|nr:class II aldolase/adducin family protein [Rhodospirillaceae bacterium]MCY4066662.1 class II aldolase/adducin family protein [Rhodospirillaceae bacterium]MYG53991.1 class II aldolase/adducin family protein [Rhodospirillaceae bacterium]
MNTVTAIRPAGSVRDRVSDEEWAVRVDLAAAYRLVAHYGWDDLIYTHISARVPGPEHHFLINPYGMMFEEITASSLIKIDMDGELVMESGYGVNKAGFTIHSAVHEARDDARCVIHLHTLDGTAVSTDSRGLLPLNQTALLIRDLIAWHDYEGVAVDLDERPRLQRDLGEKNYMLLWNHGTLTCGATVAEAFQRMYFLERACSMQVRTLSTGPDIHPPQDEIVEKTARQGANDDYFAMLSNTMAWPALLRMLDRRDPSFRE